MISLIILIALMIHNNITLRTLDIKVTNIKYLILLIMKISELQSDNKKLSADNNKLSVELQSINKSLSERMDNLEFKMSMLIEDISEIRNVKIHLILFYYKFQLDNDK